MTEGKIFGVLYFPMRIFRLPETSVRSPLGTGMSPVPPTTRCWHAQRLYRRQRAGRLMSCEVQDLGSGGVVQAPRTALHVAP